MLSVWLNIGAAKLQYLEKYNVLDSAQSQFESSYALRLEVNTEEDGVHDNNSAFEPNQTELIRPREKDFILPSATRHEYFVIMILVVWGFILSSIVFMPMSNDFRADIIGVVVNLNLVVFYGAPLSSIAIVFKTKSSKSIHKRTLGMLC